MKIETLKLSKLSPKIMTEIGLWPFPALTAPLTKQTTAQNNPTHVVDALSHDLGKYQGAQGPYPTE